MKIKKAESKWLKQNLKVARKDRVVLNDRVKEFEAMIESKENYLKELRDYKDKCTKEFR